MGVEVDGFEMVPPPAAALVEVNKAALSEKVNGQLDQGANDDGDTNFGSHGDGLAGREASKNSEANYPQDVQDEWPAHNKIHNFFLVRFRPFEDPQMKMKLDRADKEIQQKNQARFQIIDKLKTKRSERAEIISQLKALGVENKQFNMAMDERRKKMEPLQQALGKLRNPNTANRGSGLCSSEEELNDVIQSLQYRIQHESISLAEEKQIIREIKQLEGTRDKVIANAAMRAEIQGSIGPKEDIQDQVKLIGVDLDEVRKDQQAVKAKIKQLRDELDGIDSQIKALQDELEVVVENRDRAYSNLQDLRKKRDEGNVPFYQNRALFNSVRELAAKKDVVALVDLSHGEVEKFFSLWNGSKSFRDDYQKRILTSLDGRQMSRDSRTRLPSEKPLVAVEKSPAASEVEAKPKAEEKKPKEVPRSPAQEDPAPVQKVEKECTQKANEPVKKSKTKESEPKESKDDEDVYEIPKHEPLPVVQIDAEKLKEMKREEQIAKQKQALERKKKLADKNAVKAAMKAQKEAEKKLKDQEKKLKKKGGGAETEESAEADAPEPEKPEETPEAPPVQIVAREKTIKTIKVRKQPKALNSVPKAILKRRKSNNYWVWAAGSAALAVFLCLIVAFYVLR